MRKKTILMALAFVAAIITAGCTKEPEPTQPPAIPDFTYTTIENTSWKGIYNTFIQSPYGSFPFVLEWIVDFNQNGQGIVYLHAESQVINAFDQELPITSYTLGDDNTGSFVYNTKTAHFTIDGLNRTMTVDTLKMGLYTEDDGPITYYGGTTILTQTR